MIHLGPLAPGLNRIRTLFLQEGWPASLSDEAFSGLASRHTGLDLELGRGAWQLRLLDEYRSQVAFTGFLADLTELRCPFEVVAAALRVVRDEARHVELCRRMVIALGGPDALPGEPTWTGVDPRLPLRQRILFTIVGSLCVGETLSATMIASARDHAADPLAREVCGLLARDEAIHGALGWKLLELFLPHVSADELAELSRYAPASITAATAAMQTLPAPSGGRSPSHPFGSVPAVVREELLTRALNTDVFGRFQKLGLQMTPAGGAGPALSSS